MIEKVVDIVKEASKLMLTDHFGIKEKDGCVNIVTSSDIAVQRYLTEKLAESLPGSGFLCEEEDFRDLAEEYVWIIDPIDGTANYARGIADCCISVALAKGNDVRIGVVYSPGRGELFTAEKGRGAFLNGKQIHVSDRPFAAGILCCAMSTYRKEFAKICSDIIYDVYMRCNDTRRFGSAAVELCVLAAGHIDLYFEMRLQPWDYAASMLILNEAGGSISGFDGLTPSLVKPSMVLAANTRPNNEELLETVHRHLKELPY